MTSANVHRTYHVLKSGRNKTKRMIMGTPTTKQPAQKIPSQTLRLSNIGWYYCGSTETDFTQMVPVPAGKMIDKVLFVGLPSVGYSPVNVCQSPLVLRLRSK